MESIKEREELVMHGISPSRPRVEILNYLHNNFTHPTADEIFRDLRSKVPTLSLTTVYNTLKLFVSKGMCQSITINEKQVCYDGQTIEHGHFLCSICGKIYDIKDNEEQDKPHKDYLDGHHITEVHYYYKGVCAECLSSLS